MKCEMKLKVRAKLGPLFNDPMLVDYTSCLIRQGR